jgi:hypothetical protein
MFDRPGRACFDIDWTLRMGILGVGTERSADPFFLLSVFGDVDLFDLVRKPTENQYFDLNMANTVRYLQKLTI